MLAFGASPPPHHHPGPGPRIPRGRPPSPTVAPGGSGGPPARVPRVGSSCGGGPGAGRGPRGRPLARARGQRGPSGRRAAGWRAIRAGRWRPQFACSPAELREARPAPAPPSGRPRLLARARPRSARQRLHPGWRPRVDAVRRLAADPRLGRRRRGRAPPGLRTSQPPPRPSTSTPVPLRRRRRPPPQAVRLAGRRRCHLPALPLPALPRRAAAGRSPSTLRPERPRRRPRRRPL